MTLSDFECDSNVFNETEHRLIFATAEVLVIKLIVIKFHFTLASGSLNFCTKIINNIG